MPDLNKDLVSGTVGTFGKYDVSMVNGQLVASFTLSPAELLGLLVNQIKNPAIVAAIQEGEALIGLK